MGSQKLRRRTQASQTPDRRTGQIPVPPGPAAIIRRAQLLSPTPHTYSAQRLRLVVILLTVVTLPIVVGCSLLIYHYMRFSVMVERRLQGEPGWCRRASTRGRWCCGRACR